MAKIVKNSAITHAGKDKYDDGFGVVRLTFFGFFSPYTFERSIFANAPPSIKINLQNIKVITSCQFFTDKNMQVTISIQQNGGCSVLSMLILSFHFALYSAISLLLILMTTQLCTIA